MSITHKLLIDFNGQKYSVFVESDYKLLTFKTLLNQIRRQINENISHESHWFELFDKDFEEYVVIHNNEVIIENLSKIRIKTKAANKEPDVSHKSEQECQYQELVVSLPATPSKSEPKKTSNEMESFVANLFAANKTVKKPENAKTETNHTFASALKQTNDLNINTESLKTCFEEKCKLFNNLVNEKTEDLKTDSNADTRSVSSFGQTSVVSTRSELKTINYLQVIESGEEYILSPSCPHLRYRTVVNKFRQQFLVTIRFKISDYKAVQKLLELMAINRKCFENNRSNQIESLSLKWKTVSDQMIVNAFKEWSPEKCKQGFKCALDLYKKTLDACPDFETAAEVNSLFYDLHSYDLKFLISLAEFEEVRDLRDMFQRQLSNKSRHYSRFRSNLSSIASKQKDLVFSNNNRFNSSQSLNKWSDPKHVSGYSGYRSQNDLTKLRTVGAKMDENAINEFKLLAESVQIIATQFGHVSEAKNFWKLVSDRMHRKGYDIKGIHCWEQFSQYVCDYYSLALTHCEDETSAQELYPLFSTIHSMDLSKCLSQFSYEKITQTRLDFNKKKSGKSWQNSSQDWYKPKSEIDKTKLRNISSRIDSHAVEEFKTLVESVETIGQQFGSVLHVKHFWQLVANQMVANGYITFDEASARKLFTEHVNDTYALALNYSSEIRPQKYPFFDIIHSMDLSNCLTPNSFHRINHLREEYNERESKSSKNHF